MLLTLLSKSLHDAAFLWPFLSHQPLTNEFKHFKDFETFEYYGIRIETFELTAVEKTRLRNQNSNYMMKNTSRRPKNLFDLDDFLNYVSSN